MIEAVNLFVDEQAVRHNTQILKTKLGSDTQILAVIKANGYGLGLKQLGLLCQDMGIDVMAVLDLDQAKDLRDAGVHTPILIMGATLESNFKYIHELDVMQVIIDHNYAEKMNAFALENGIKLKTHVKVDTGLNRLGMKSYDEIKSCYEMPGLDVRGIYSHFVEAQGYAGDAVAFSQLQIERYNTVLDQLKRDNINPQMTHIQNSPSILHFGDLGYDAVRCGMVMFGLFHPSQLEQSISEGYLPVMRLESRVAMVRNIQKGEFVGYSRSFVADKDIRLATISAGYCDGIMKGLSLNGGGVYINDVWCPILGDIAMSQFMVDVTGVDCEAEDRVIIFGHEKQSIYDYIALTGQSINEMISALRYTMPRIYENK